MASTPLKEPHFLLASSNSRKMLNNIRHVISGESAQAIETEIERNSIELFNLGIDHFDFAKKAPRRQWRQRISRLYYGAYNIKRSVQLYVDGTFRTDSTDHKKIGDLPPGFPNQNTYSSFLNGLREDRNLSDYNHTATIDDLLMPPNDTEQMVQDFVNDARNFLLSKGAKI